MDDEETNAVRHRIYTIKARYGPADKRTLSNVTDHIRSCFSSSEDGQLHIVIVAHGWRNEDDFAQYSYRRLLANYCKACASAGDFSRVAVVGVIWESRPGASWWRSVGLQRLEVVSFWQMKDRAKEIGRTFVHDVALHVRDVFRSARIHFFGHSFGALLVTAAAANPVPCSPPFGALVLIQAAFNANSFSPHYVPDATPLTGEYSDVPEQLCGPVIVTYSKHDVALNQAFQRWTRNSPGGGQLGDQDQTRRGWQIWYHRKWFRALGAVGVTNTPCVDMPMTGFAEHIAKTTGPVLYSLDSCEQISEHADWTNEALAELLYVAVQSTESSTQLGDANGRPPESCFWPTYRLIEGDGRTSMNGRSHRFSALSPKIWLHGRFLCILVCCWAFLDRKGTTPWQ